MASRNNAQYAGGYFAMMELQNLMPFKPIMIPSSVQEPSPRRRRWKTSFMRDTMELVVRVPATMGVVEKCMKEKDTFAAIKI